MRAHWTEWRLNFATRQLIEARGQLLARQRAEHIEGEAVCCGCLLLLLFSSSVVIYGFTIITLAHSHSLTRIPLRRTHTNALLHYSLQCCARRSARVGGRVAKSGPAQGQEGRLRQAITLMATSGGSEHSA